MEERNEIIEIDYALLLRKLWKNKVIILLVGIIFAAGMVAHNKLIAKPVYESSTKIYTVNQSTDAQALTYQDLQLGINLVKDYEQIIRSKEVMNSVIDMLQMETSPERLAKKVSVSSPKDTRVIEIKVVDYNPEQSAILANAIRDASVQKIKEITKINDLTVIEQAVKPKQPFAPKIKKNAVYAFLAGLVLASGLIVIKEILDDCVKRPEDVEQTLGMVLLGSIPNTGRGKKR